MVLEEEKVAYYAILAHWLDSHSEVRAFFQEDVDKETLLRREKIAIAKSELMADCLDDSAALRYFANYCQHITVEVVKLPPLEKELQ